MSIGNGINGSECVGCYGTMESALAELGKLMIVQSPLEVILIGIGLPGLSGSQSIWRLKKQQPPSPKVARRADEKLQVHSKSEAVARA